MQLWIDSINLDLIKEAQLNGKLTGVTNNPAILSQTDIMPEKKLQQLLEIQSGYVATQVVANDTAGMIEQAKRLAAIDPRIIVKIPVNPNGLKAITALSAANIATLATAIFEPSQVYLASLAGAMYVAPYLSRIDEHPEHCLEVLGDMLDILEIHRLPTKLMAAAINSKQQVITCASLGAHAITLPESVYLDLIGTHPQTANSLHQFETAWRAGKHIQPSKVF